MKKSRVCALGLACFLSAVTAFSALAATSGGGGALLRNLSDNSALSSASLSGQNGAENLTPEEQAKAELNANILAGGGLGLDPENDPVIATTDWGLDIKFHNDWGSFGTSTNSEGVSGYCYFEMGSYNGTKVKWVIIGRATDVAQTIYYDGTYSSLGTKYTTYTAAVYPNYSTAKSTYYKNNQYETTTDAGSAIANAGNNGLVYDFNNLLFANSVSNKEIPSRSVLCISEKVICTSVFTSQANHNSRSDGTYLNANRWAYSTLRSTMNTLYESGLGLSTTQKNRIQQVSIKTYAIKGLSITDYSVGADVTTDHFFALANAYYNSRNELHYDPASYPQHYRLETYLGSTKDNWSERVVAKKGLDGSDIYWWWLRSGKDRLNQYAAYAGGFAVCNSDGGSVNNANSSMTIYNSYGVRPAFVLKIT